MRNNDDDIVSGIVGCVTIALIIGVYLIDDWRSTLLTILTLIFLFFLFCAIPFLIDFVCRIFKRNKSSHLDD